MATSTLTLFEESNLREFERRFWKRSLMNWFAITKCVSESIWQ